ncbi:phosphatase PAP2 family protein [Glacieibacterium sp.]|uniref:phosphatase PAP2 family protein n=1 Tax=Glacieibacterium sp. TaxID=2860237 RepID=UPI003B008283
MTAPPRSRIAAAWQELRPFQVFVAIACALLVFVRLGSEVREGESFFYDRWLLLALRHADDLSVPIGPAWLKRAMIDFTGFGDVTGLTLVTIAAAGYLIAARRYRTALFLSGAAISGSVIGGVLKAFFARPRPDVVPHLVQVTNLSFPSGHALNSAVIYLTIGLILARSATDRRVQRYIHGVAIFMTTGLGISRIYLGVHYPSDVLAGWLAGAAFATLIWTLALSLERRREIEPPAPK